MERRRPDSAQNVLARSFLAGDSSESLLDCFPSLKAITPDEIANAIENDWTPEADPEEFVRTIVPDPWSAEQSDDEDQSPIGQLCSVFDEREQTAVFFTEYDHPLADHLERIADAVKLRKEQDAVKEDNERQERERRERERLEVKDAVRRELARQEREREAAGSGDGSSETPEDEDARRRRIIRENKHLEGKEFFQALHDEHVRPKQSWIDEGCRDDYLVIYEIPYWRDKVLKERYDVEKRIKS
ncbi:MAG TPA: hypothetical protein VMS18_18860 [Candidatus Binatia bacterium]|nr:hypothetical protein [Candidatus Binatia bacterium]